MLSKVAERVYWMVRYLERAEDAARLISVYGDVLLDLPRSTGVGWREIGTVLGVPPARTGRGRRPVTDRSMLELLLADADNPGSVLFSITAARENARTTRDLLPTEAWRTVNELHLYASRQLPRAIGQRHRNSILSEIVSRCQKIAGLLMGTMSHGPAYQFVRIGRFVERADMTTRVIDVAAALLLTGKQDLVEFDNTLWIAVLRSLSGYQMYRQYVRRRVESADVLRYLLQDPEFPRTVRYCAQQLQGASAQLPNPDDVMAVADKLMAELDRTHPARMTPDEVHDLVERLQEKLAELHLAVTATWFRPGAAA